jgi:hypothetical protein
MNERIQHLKWQLVDQINDLATGTEAIREHVEKMESDSPPNPKWSVAYFRMCSTFLIITLAKLLETLKHYSNDIRTISFDLGKACDRVRKEIDQREIRQFRNKYAAHALDQATGKPLNLAEGEKRYKVIVGETVGDIIAFCDWISPPRNSVDVKSIIRTVADVRDECLALVASEPQRP